LKKGFTLVEIAIALVILGLIIGIGTATMIQFIKWNKRQQTEKLVESAVNELIGQSSNGSISLSSLPKLVDAYSQKINFVIASKLTPSYLGNATICDLKDTELTLYDNGTGTTVGNVAFLAFSNGSDYTSNTYCNGILVTKNTPCTGNVTTDSTKDIIKFITLPELKQYLGCPGNPLHILNNELPVAYVGDNYTAVLYASGGIKPYNWKITNTNCNFFFSNFSTNSTGNHLKISGIPTKQGNCILTVSVSDNNTPTPFTDTKTFSIDILQTTGSSNSTNGTSCTTYNLVVSLSWRAVGILGLSINNSCNLLLSSTYSTTGLAPSTLIGISFLCLPDYTLLSGTAQDLDTNNDCTVNIRCGPGRCNYY